MANGIVFLADGFEETEAVGTIDVLRRGDIDTLVVSISNSLSVKGAHGIVINADRIISDVNLSAYDVLVLPGGMPGTTNLGNCKVLTDALVSQYKNGKVVAAICAAPSVFGTLSIADGHRVTCYPGFESYLVSSEVTGLEAEVDSNVITGRGPGTVFDFALRIVEKLQGREVAQSVAQGMTGAERFGY